MNRTTSESFPWTLSRTLWTSTSPFGRRARGLVVAISLLLDGCLAFRLRPPELLETTKLQGVSADLFHELLYPAPEIGGDVLGDEWTAWRRAIQAGNHAVRKNITGIKSIALRLKTVSVHGASHLRRSIAKKAQWLKPGASLVSAHTPHVYTWDVPEVDFTSFRIAPVDQSSPPP